MIRLGYTKGSHDYSVRGTKGEYDEARQVMFLDGMKKGIKENDAEFFEKYDHPLQAEYVKWAKKRAWRRGWQLPLFPSSR